MSVVLAKSHGAGRTCTRQCGRNRSKGDAWLGGSTLMAMHRVIWPVTAARLTVAAVDALLYLPGPPEGEIERALRIPALSLGWKSSFDALLRQMAQPGSHTGNAGLASPEQMVTAAPGFRSLKVARIDRESSSVVSLVLEPAAARPLSIPLAGEFVVLRPRVAGVAA